MIQCRNHHRQMLYSAHYIWWTRDHRLMYMTDRWNSATWALNHWRNGMLTRRRQSQFAHDATSAEYQISWDLDGCLRVVQRDGHISYAEYHICWNTIYNLLSRRKGFWWQHSVRKRFWTIPVMNGVRLGQCSNTNTFRRRLSRPSNQDTFDFIRWDRTCVPIDALQNRVKTSLRSLSW